MIDIHCHIVFGVDDGSFSLSESVEMARVALEGGTDVIIATPHANAPDLDPNDWDAEFDKKLKSLNDALVSEGIPLTVCPGHEVFCSDNVVRLYRGGKLMTLNRSRYLLIEFDFYSDVESMLAYCDDLSDQGVIPVIAHPERYEAIKEDLDAAFRLKRHGCLLQLNGGSLFGAFGRASREVAHDLIGEYAADFIASDAHSPYMRTPYLADAHEMVCELYSPDYADLLFDENPRRVLQNEETLVF